ncbi:MAG: TIGR04282 family arsenosugar biosynthesis glycosyltransferase [Candidatus Sulfobium sp.]
MAHRNLLGLVARYPAAGTVKTRLAKDIGCFAACRVYRILAERIIAETGPAAGSYDRIIFYSSPGASEDKVREWLPGERLVPQKGADIGQIMENALGEMFDDGAGKAIIAGVDVPGLNRHIVDLAFKELESADIVIGPATDGGYYLVGMKTPVPGVFRGMPWGTSRVFGETLRVTGGLGLTVATVASMRDVDTLDDLLKAADMYPAFFRGM